MNEREYERMFRVEDSHWWYAGLHELILETVTAEKHEEPLAILDAGCGTGRLCQLLQSVGTVAGCDASPQALAFSRSRGVSGLFHADLNKVDLGEKRYDVITSIDVLYHQAVTDEENIISRFYRALKPGGLLILNLVAFEFLRSTHDIAVHTRKRYTLGGLLPSLKGQGYSIEKATYRLGFLFFPIAFYRLAKKLLPHSSQREQVDSDVYLPPSVINSLLLQLVRAENSFLHHCSLPFGTSVYVAARRPLI
ncbi:class I SAM-dependent methyltransferase [Geotalea toluenoxydans]|uniref:class I SAM-dependent methyltransferase n=1 Tax=Geotalea toluenoxydans TaxID=421624 RepID=UPI0006D14E5F|nr:class I SAM-dependent methyltransferase [Geotalea toluenoxydans]